MAQELVVSVQGGVSGILKTMNDLKWVQVFTTWDWNHLGEKKCLINSMDVINPFYLPWPRTKSNLRSREICGVQSFDMLLEVLLHQKKNIFLGK